MLDEKMTGSHLKLCIVFGSNVRRKNVSFTYQIMYRLRLYYQTQKWRLHILNYVSSSALMLDAKMTAPHIKLYIVFGSNVRRKNDGSTY